MTLLDYGVAVERYLAGSGIASSSARIYRISLLTWGWLFAGEPAPTGRDRRGALPPSVPLPALGAPGLRPLLAELAAERADRTARDTTIRELVVVRRAISWWIERGWLSTDPTRGIERRPAPEDPQRPLTPHQLAALWRVPVTPRDAVLWRMRHESGAALEDLLRLDVADLRPTEFRGLARLGAATAATADTTTADTATDSPQGTRLRWIHWGEATAAALPRLLAERRSGPLFGVGWSRLTPAATEQAFEHATRLAANPLASARHRDRLTGWSMSRLAPAATRDRRTAPRSAALVSVQTIGCSRERMH